MSNSITLPFFPVYFLVVFFCTYSRKQDYVKLRKNGIFISNSIGHFEICTKDNMIYFLYYIWLCYEYVFRITKVRFMIYDNIIEYLIRKLVGLQESFSLSYLYKTLHFLPRTERYKRTKWDWWYLLSHSFTFSIQASLLKDKLQEASVHNLWPIFVYTIKHHINVRYIMQT